MLWGKCTLRLGARQDGGRLGYTWLALAKGRLRDTQGAVGAFGISAYLYGGFDDAVRFVCISGKP